MARQLITYYEAEAIRKKLEREKINEKYWQEFANLDEDGLTKKAEEVFKRNHIIEKQIRKLEKLAKRFSFVCSGLSPGYAKLKKIALKREERYARIIRKCYTVYKIAENREIDISPSYRYW
jgi:hypothetical protein